MDDHSEIFRIIRHNKWTISYVALIATMLLILRIYELARR